MTAESFDTIATRAYTQPPVNDEESNGFYAHAYLGRHATFTGRPYRRGKMRCLRCGAPIVAKDGPPDPDRHLNVRQRVQKNLARPNVLLRYIQGSHAG